MISILSTSTFMLGLIRTHNIVDKSGECYFGHLDRVAIQLKNKYGKNELLINLAYLHDSVEDKLTTYEELIDRGYDEKIINGLRLLTRDEKVSYAEYIQNIVDSKNLEVLLVKRADLEDNMNLTRLKNISEKDVKRLEKRYIPAWYKINNAIINIELTNN